MTFIKVCGITRPTDAELAARLGANWIGFVFWPQSPRFVEPGVAAQILETLPPHVGGVGVFVDQTISEVNEISERVRLSAVQLHGNELSAVCPHFSRRVIKAVRLSRTDKPDIVNGVWSKATLLLDSFDPIKKGGTGKQVDLDLAAQISRRRRTILAGGLRAETVAEAVRRVSPYGLDVSSGVESSPGIKSPERMRAFFEAVTMANKESLSISSSVLKQR